MYKILGTKQYWKAYGLTLAQTALFAASTFLAVMLIITSFASVYPFLQIMQQIESGVDITLIADQFMQNHALFVQFIISLIVIVIGYVILSSGILSLFDIMILDRLDVKIHDRNARQEEQKGKFDTRRWILAWFNHSSMGLLLLMLISVIFYTVRSNIWLLVLITLSYIIFSYLIVLMQFKVNLLSGIRATILRALLLLLYYLVLFIITLLLIGLLKFVGFIVGVLLFVCLLLWSKIYIMAGLEKGDPANAHN